MAQLDIPPEMVAITKWLESEFFEIGLFCIEGDPYKISAVKYQDRHKFELNIECDYFQGIYIITVKCIVEIKKVKYSFLLQLLNFININRDLDTFTFDPLTRKLCCKSVNGTSGEIAYSVDLQERIEAYTYDAMSDITKIINILRENIGLEEAVCRIIGDERMILEESIN